MSANKRKKEESPPINFLEPDFDNYTFFEIKHSQGMSLYNLLNPFKLAADLEKNLKTPPKAVKRQKSGTIVVEVHNYQQAKAIMGIKTIGQVPVIVTPHSSLNYSKGVLKCWELDSMETTEIQDALASQNVIHVRRLTKVNSSSSKIIPVFVLTFSTKNLPQTVRILYTQYNIEQYYRQPLRCFRCQRYGHALPCSRPNVCPNCAIQHDGTHNEAECENPPKCAACLEDGHNVRSNSCPIYKKECNTVRLSQSEKMSIPEARKIVNATPESKKSFKTFSEALKASGQLTQFSQQSFVSTQLSQQTLASTQYTQEPLAHIQQTPIISNSDNYNKLPTITIPINKKEHLQTQSETPMSSKAIAEYSAPSQITKETSNCTMCPVVITALAEISTQMTTLIKLVNKLITQNQPPKSKGLKNNTSQTNKQHEANKNHQEQQNKDFHETIENHDMETNDIINETHSIINNIHKVQPIINNTNDPTEILTSQENNESNIKQTYKQI